MDIYHSVRARLDESDRLLLGGDDGGVTSSTTDRLSSVLSLWEGLTILWDKPGKLSDLNLPSLIETVGLSRVLNLLSRTMAIDPDVSTVP